jgi:menaquinone-specific isochorismate synthase
VNIENAQSHLIELHLNGATSPYVDLKLTGDLLSLLAQQTNVPKIYWHARETDEIFVGLGISDQLLSADRPLNTLRQRAENLEAPFRYFGGFSFSGKAHGNSSFSKNNFWLPTWMIWKRDNLCTLHYHPPLRSIIPRQQAIFPQKRQFSLEEWNIMFKEAELLLQSKLKKIVLAVENHQVSALPPEAWLHQITDPYNYNFLFSPDGHTSFLGSSPEKLFSITDNILLTEALAGTRARSLDPLEDSSLASTLLNSIKDLEEHQLVIDGIQQALQPYVHKFSTIKSPQIRHQQHVQHLYTPIEAELKESEEVGTMDSIFQALHPTPAVCGFPKELALKEIERIEDFERGWYAGAVGWISSTSIDFAVAIRSALRNKQDSWFWAGAGLLKSSNPLEEWKEIQAKSIQFRELS